MDAIILDLGTTVKGNSSIEGYAGKIDLLSYSHNVDMQAASEPGKAESTSGDFVITKLVDSSSADINSYCCAGKPIAEAKVIVGQNATEGCGGFVPLIVYTLGNVLISSVSVGGGSGGVPVETISLNFTKIAWALTARKQDGIKDGTPAAQASAPNMLT